MDHVFFRVCWTHFWFWNHFSTPWEATETGRGIFTEQNHRNCWWMFFCGKFLSCLDPHLRELFYPYLFAFYMGVSKIVVPQNGWFIRANPIKMDDLGVPLFLETPISIILFGYVEQKEIYNIHVIWRCV